MTKLAKRFAPFALVAVLGLAVACDSSNVPTEPGLTDGSAVEVIDGIQFKKTDGLLVMSTMDDPMVDYECFPIDFKDFGDGEVVTETTFDGETVGVAITSFGGPANGSTGTGHAVIYDTDPPTGADPDLDAAGQLQNLGNVIIHQEDNGDGGPVNGFYATPDDADVPARMQFSFPAGDYMVKGFKALDQEGPEGEYIALRIDILTDNSEVAKTTVTIDNESKVEMVAVTPNAVFSNTLEFEFEGSGAVDDIMVCKAVERGDEGCTPGYWKQEQHFGSWPVNPYTYTFGEAFATACGEAAYPARQPDDDLGDICDLLLLDALKLRGGGVNALSRHAAAGWLNATSSVNYMWSLAEVEAAFMAENKDVLEDANESYCPLGRDEGEWEPVQLPS